MTTHRWIFIALWLGTCLYAMVRGGSPERVMGVLFLFAALATRAAGRLAGEQYVDVAAGILLVDAAMLGVILGLALTSARFWPMPMASMQAAELLGHFARSIGQEIVPPAYYATVAGWSYPMLLLLLVATVRHRRRLRRYAVDPAWSHDLPAAYRAGASADEAGGARDG